MKISFLKLSRKKEVIKRIELSEVAEMIRENPEKDRVFGVLALREMKLQFLGTGFLCRAKLFDKQ